MNGPPISPPTYTGSLAQASSADAIRGRICVITGATRGIGRATAYGLASLGARVVLVGRDERLLRETTNEIRRDARAEAVFAVRADLASLESIREAAAEIGQRWPAIHALVNNAGVNSKRLALSADGYELTFAVNHVAPFLLTSLLAPALSRGAPSRVVNVTSIFAHLATIDLDDPEGRRRRYDPTRAYNQSKLANVMFTLELAERLRGSGVTANCVSPGLVATDLLREHWWMTSPGLRWFWNHVLLTPERAAERVVNAVVAPALVDETGQAFAGSERGIGIRGTGSRRVRIPRQARSAHARERLWSWSAAATSAPVIGAGVHGSR